MIYLTIEGQEMAGILTAPLVSGQVNFVDVKTIFDSTWDDLNKSYQFHNGDTVSEVDSNDEIIKLPYEATAFPGTLEINVVGTKLDDDGITVLKKATTNTLRFKVGCCNLDDNPDNCGDVSATVVEQIRQIAESAEDKATEAERISAVIWEAYRSGELNGKDGRNGVDGVSPTFETKQSEGGATITITDVDGTHDVFLKDGPQGEQGPRGETGPRGERGLTGNSGANGKDGVSPTVSTTQTSTGAKITIKDATGTHVAELLNGKDGKDGVNGKDGTMSFEELTDEQKATLKGDPGEPGKPGADGKDGQAGKDGNDGYSPTAKVSQTSTGATITITDKNGTTTATVVNGVDGKDGSSGADGQPGKDGLTPFIGDNGNWWIGDTDTGVSSGGGASSGYREVNLISEPVLYTQGGTNGTTIGQDLTLLDDITKYDEIVFNIGATDSNKVMNSHPENFKVLVSNVVYNSTTTNTFDGSRFTLSLLAVDRRLGCWFKDSKTLYIYNTYTLNTFNATAYFRINSIKGIKF